MAARRGRILAIKPGLNPNSSSLGVDITFLLLGSAALAVMTPVIASFLRLRRPMAAGEVLINDAPVDPPARPAQDDR